MNLKPHLIVGVVVGLAALFLTWLTVAETSPFADYFLWHDEASNFWGALNILPYIGGIILGGNHAGPNPVAFFLLLFVQWFLVGVVVSRLFSSVFRKHDRIQSIKG
jgi:hypothetical protein